MPYVNNDIRNKLDDAINTLANELKNIEKNDPKAVDGALNYTVTKLLNEIYPQPYSYYNLNRAYGVVNCLRDEFYHRVVRPYENQKIFENGDVYPSPVENSNSQQGVISWGTGAWGGGNQKHNCSQSCEGEVFVNPNLGKN